MPISEFDRLCLDEAVNLALDAEGKGNLPIGAVISLGGKIIARGQNSIWSPELCLSRHAEMEALAAIPSASKERARAMTLYTTLEPCLMCFGAILLHQIGSVLFGSADGFGGASTVIGCLPTYFANQFSMIKWSGPAYPEACDPLYQRIKSLEKMKNIEME